MLSRKDYIAIASIIKENLKDAGDIEAQKYAIELMASDLIDYMQADNERFDIDKFEKASGLK